MGQGVREAARALAAAATSGAAVMGRPIDEQVGAVGERLLAGWPPAPGRWRRPPAGRTPGVISTMSGPDLGAHGGDLLRRAHEGAARRRRRRARPAGVRRRAPARAGRPRQVGRGQRREHGHAGDLVSGSASTAARTMAAPPLAWTVRYAGASCGDRAGRTGDGVRDVVQLEVEEHLARRRRRAHPRDRRRRRSAGSSSSPTLTVLTCGPPALRPARARSRGPARRARRRSGAVRSTAASGQPGSSFDARRDRSSTRAASPGPSPTCGRAIGGGARVGLAVRVADGVGEPVEAALGERLASSRRRGRAPTGRGRSRCRRRPPRRRRGRTPARRSRCGSPPMPRIGTSGRAACTCHTQRTATGRIAGPDSPPVTPASAGRIVSVSMTMPSSVLIIDRPSAPASTHAAGDRDDVGDVGRELGEHRHPGGAVAAHGGDDRGGGRRVAREHLAAVLDVGAARC